MDVVVKGRRCEVSDGFRAHVQEKLDRVRLDPRAQRVDVLVVEEPASRKADERIRVEITVVSRGPVVRAEAEADDRYAALDLAVTRLSARLRKQAERRREHRGGRRVSLAQASAVLPDGDGRAGIAGPASEAADAEPVAVRREGSVEVQGDGPLVVREKTHAGAPMSLDQALYEMELVGHDFYLFVDADSGLPSVVYRRRGFDYGVIRLQV